MLLVAHLCAAHYRAITLCCIQPTCSHSVFAGACDNPEQILKLETTLFAGAVLDIAWSGDSQRILAVGDGSNIYGKVIMWDSGNSVGEITGHMKKINSCTFKSTRPFRLATGGEDNKVNFYEGRASVPLQPRGLAFLGRGLPRHLPRHPPRHRLRLSQPRVPQHHSSSRRRPKHTNVSSTRWPTRPIRNASSVLRPTRTSLSSTERMAHS